MQILHHVCVLASLLDHPEFVSFTPALPNSAEFVMRVTNGKHVRSQGRFKCICRLYNECPGASVSSIVARATQ